MSIPPPPPLSILGPNGTGTFLPPPSTLSYIEPPRAPAPTAMTLPTQLSQPSTIPAPVQPQADPAQPGEIQPIAEVPAMEGGGIGERMCPLSLKSVMMLNQSLKYFAQNFNSFAINIEDEILEAERIVTRGEILMDLLEQKMSAIPTDLPRAVDDNPVPVDGATPGTTQDPNNQASGQAGVPPPPNINIPAVTTGPTPPGVPPPPPMDLLSNINIPTAKPPVEADSKSGEGESSSSSSGDDENASGEDGSGTEEEAPPPEPRFRKLEEEEMEELREKLKKYILMKSFGMNMMDLEKKMEKDGYDIEELDLYFAQRNL